MSLLEKDTIHGKYNDKCNGEDQCIECKYCTSYEYAKHLDNCSNYNLSYVEMLAKEISISYNYDPSKKISAIKDLRALLIGKGLGKSEENPKGYGLKEAKDLIEKFITSKMTEDYYKEKAIETNNIILAAGKMYTSNHMVCDCSCSKCNGVDKCGECGWCTSEYHVQSNSAHMFNCSKFIAPGKISNDTIDILNNANKIAAMEDKIEKKNVAIEESKAMVEPSNKNQKYKVFIWKIVNPLEDMTELGNWQLITKEVVLSYSEVKAIIEKSKGDEYVVFARKVGGQKDAFQGALYSFPAKLDVYKINILYKEYLKEKKGYSSFDEIEKVMATKVKPSYKPKVKKPVYTSHGHIKEPAYSEVVTSEMVWLRDVLGCKGFPARSQKIKGLRNASEIMERVTEPSFIRSAVVISEESDLSVKHNHYGTKNGRATRDSIIESMIGNFVRPCPLNPEHGFVDSRLISNTKEANEILEEIAKTGEIAEAIIMPKIDCEYSGVICPDRIAFGSNNDGATQGKDVVGLALSLSPEVREKIRYNFWKGTKEWPFVEVLYNSHPKPILVQMRSGPSMEVKAKKVVIREIHIVDSSMDLIEWGKEAKVIREKVKILNENNTSEIENSIAIWHPNGEPLSHFGVHCRTVEPVLPYLTSSEKPVVGSVIEIGVKGKTRLSAVKEGLLLGLEAKIDGDYHEKSWQKAVNDLHSFLGALHISSIADLGDEVTARFIGYSWGIGARVISGLPFGECVHQKEARNATGKVIGTHNALGNERDYGKIWRLELETIVAGLVECERSFLGYGWSSGYGGKKWASCTMSLLRVFNKMRIFINLPTTEGFNGMVDSINIMVNEVHNGGWWLNKMSSKQMFDDASVLPHFMLSPRRALEVKDMKVGAFAIKLKTQQVVKMLDVSDIEAKIEAQAKAAEAAQAVAMIKAKVEAEKVAAKMKKEMEDIVKGHAEYVGKVGFGKAGQFHLMSGAIHIQIKSPVALNGAYGASYNLEVNSGIMKILSNHHAKQSPKLESFASLGTFKYALLGVFKEIPSKGGKLLLKVGDVLVPVEDMGLWDILDKLEKGEANSPSTTPKKSLKKAFVMEEVEVKVESYLAKCNCHCDNCTGEDKCSECYFCTALPKHEGDSHEEGCSHYSE